MIEFKVGLKADVHAINKLIYDTRFIELLNEINKCYSFLRIDNPEIPKKENDIRDLLVDKYLVKHMLDYSFKKEEYNNQGRVDIYIVDKITLNKPKFIIECKLIDNHNVNGTTGLNAEYIKEGIYRFLSEYYFIENNYHTNCMIGFVIEDLDLNQNIISLNSLSNILFKNLVEITHEIKPHINNIYQSKYLTCNKKEFTVYHLMMDFTK